MRVQELDPAPVLELCPNFDRDDLNLLSGAASIRKLLQHKPQPDVPTGLSQILRPETRWLGFEPPESQLRTSFLRPILTIMDWKETIRRWRALSPEERLRREWEQIPENVAQSMAFEG